MCKHVHETALRELPELVEVALPCPSGSDLTDQARLGIESEAVEEMARAVEVVPGVSAEDLGHADGAAPNPVDLDAQLDREPQPPRLPHPVAVPVEVVATALDVVRNGPELASLAEVVDVLGKADLVDAALPRDLDEALHGRHAEVDRLVGCAEMHV